MVNELVMSQDKHRLWIVPVLVLGLGAAIVGGIYLARGQGIFGPGFDPKDLDRTLEWLEKEHEKIEKGDSANRDRKFKELQVQGTASEGPIPCGEEGEVDVRGERSRPERSEVRGRLAEEGRLSHAPLVWKMWSWLDDRQGDQQGGSEHSQAGGHRTHHGHDQDQ